MTNSKRSKSWVNLLKTVGWVLSFVGKFLPAKFRLITVVISTILGGVIGLLEKCDSMTPAPKQEPAKKIEPTPVPPKPEPTPQPTPTRPPLPELKAPRYVKSGVPFWVELCGVGNVYGVELFAESHRLGYMGFGKPCMRLSITLNSRGNRKLIARGPELTLSTDVILQ